MLQREMLELTACYLRRTPVEAGRWRLIDRAVGWTRALNLSGERRIRTRHGFVMQLDLGDWLGRHVFATGEYEPATTNLVRRLMKKGMTAIDVGANVGYFTLLLARCVGPQGKVTAFEPIPRVREALLRNVGLNHLPQVVVRSEALGEDTGEATMWEGPANHVGISSRRELADGRAARTLTVPTARLDDIIPADHPVDLVKIDVEGFEFEVIRGAAQLLERARPNLIVEITDEFLRQRGHSANAVLRFFLDRGFEAHRIDWTGLRPWRLQDDIPPQFNALFHDSSSPAC